MKISYFRRACFCITGVVLCVLCGFCLGRLTSGTKIIINTNSLADLSFYSSSSVASAFTSASSSVPPQAEDAVLKPGSVNINTASAKELQSLPGIGQVMSERIVAYRTDNGFFQSVEELGQVDGIGAQTLQNIIEYCTVD